MLIVGRACLHIYATSTTNCCGCFVVCNFVVFWVSSLSFFSVFLTWYCSYARCLACLCVFVGGRPDLGGSFCVLFCFVFVLFFCLFSLCYYCPSHLLRGGTTAILPRRCRRSTKDAVDESRKETADRVARYQADC